MKCNEMHHRVSIRIGEDLANTDIFYDGQTVKVHFSSDTTFSYFYFFI